MRPALSTLRNFTYHCCQSSPDVVLASSDSELRARTSSRRPWTSSVRTGLATKDDGSPSEFYASPTTKDHYRRVPLEGTRQMPEIRSDY